MTTLAVVQKEGLIAIGADSRRSSYQDMYPADVAADIDKINQVGENFIATCGSASWPTVVQLYFAGLEKTPSMRTPAEVFQVVTKLHDFAKDEYHFCADHDEGNFEGNGMDMLIANPFGIFTVSSRRNVTQLKKYWAQGAGEAYALGAMSVIYDSPAKAPEIVEIALQAGATFHSGTAPPFRIFSIPQGTHEAKKTDA